MAERILIAYASGCGATGEVAEAIGKVLSEGGARVDVRRAKEVSDLSQYGAVVVGSAIRAGKWLGEATKLVKANQAKLSRVPVAYFITCLTLSQDTPENRRVVAAYSDPLKAIVQPVAVGDFAGTLEYARLPLPLRLILKHGMKAPEGDYRDWEAIRAWAQEVGPLLSVGSRA